MRAAALAILLLLTAALPCRAADRPAEEHAGKPILRNTVAPASTQPAQLQPPVDLDAGRVALALIGVIGLIFILRYAGKQLFPSMIAAGHSQTVRVLARCPLAPRQQVVLIQVGKRIVVAADCASQLSSLCQITEADEVAAILGEIQRDKSGPITRPFTSWFNRASQAFGEEHEELEKTDEPSDATDGPTQTDIQGLTEKVRQLARQLGKST